MISLPQLPWGESDLAPHISQETISFHYGKHHKAYVDNANKMIEGTDLASAALEDIVKGVWGKPDKKGLFNNAAQVWNHTFYWSRMKPEGGGQPTAGSCDDPERLWLLREIQGGAFDDGRDPVRQRLGVARPQGRQARRSGRRRTPTRR